jgi:hypothetical protein
LLNCSWDDVTLAPKWRKPFGLLAERLSNSTSRGGQTELEPWIERFCVEFCLSPPVGFDLVLLERLVA